MPLAPRRGCRWQAADIGACASLLGVGASCTRAHTAGLCGLVPAPLLGAVAMCSLPAPLLGIEVVYSCRHWALRPCAHAVGRYGLVPMPLLGAVVACPRHVVVAPALVCGCVPACSCICWALGLRAHASTERCGRVHLLGLHPRAGRLKEVYEYGGNENEYSGDTSDGSHNLDASGEDDFSQITRSNPQDVEGFAITEVKNDEPSKLKVGEAVFHTAFFEYGLRLPLIPMFREILQKWGLAPGQLTPNSWRSLVCCYILWKELRMTLMAEEFIYMYRLKKDYLS
ncbi:hypothetical protein FNV43_RR21809 [Rhamnella rubrinervis]|uniref:Transposase (putative) gypsy type domain-containing protein n=1 Tax=Rhamnella rubrinervis TaxID=2594499 RepID=A0A8K0GQG8_9ROSA|nr:hypothetical protein FNV43_RR21809 [Rhamnella rubrinervis]